MYKCLLLVSTLMVFNFAHSSLESSIDSLKLEIEKTPDDYCLHFKLGMCYYSLQDYDQAFREFVKVLSVKEDHIPTMRRLVLVYGHLGEYERMLEFCKTTMRKLAKPSYFFSYAFGIANALQKNYGTAIECYNEALTLSPHRRDEYTKELQLAMIYHCMNNTTRANELFNKSLKKISKYRKSSKAIWHFWFGDFDRAYKIQSREKKECVDLYNLGVYQISSGDAEGLVTIKSACDKDTTGFVQALYDAIIYIKHDSLSNAESKLKQDIPALGYSGMANGILAWTLEKLGKTKEARTHWFKCYGKLPLCVEVEAMRDFIDDFLSRIQ